MSTNPKTAEQTPSMNWDNDLIPSFMSRCSFYSPFQDYETKTHGVHHETLLPPLLIEDLLSHSVTNTITDRSVHQLAMEGVQLLLGKSESKVAFGVMQHVIYKAYAFDLPTNIQELATMVKTKTLSDFLALGNGDACMIVGTSGKKLTDFAESGKISSLAKDFAGTLKDTYEKFGANNIPTSFLEHYAAAHSLSDTTRFAARPYTWTGVSPIPVSRLTSNSDGKNEMIPVNTDNWELSSTLPVVSDIIFFIRAKQEDLAVTGAEFQYLKRICIGMITADTGDVLFAFSLITLRWFLALRATTSLLPVLQISAKGEA